MDVQRSAGTEVEPSPNAGAAPLLVEVRRAGVVEATHRVHAVATRHGAVVAAAGDPHLVTFLRSSAKPLQARQLLLADAHLPSDLLAIACASHAATAEQLEAVERLLARAGATPDDLALGEQEGRGPERIRHNCSGKHAGMLLACSVHGWPYAGYHRPEHPLQQAILADVAAAAGVDEAAITVGVDGCAVPCFALPLDRCAHAFSRADDEILAAMRAFPSFVGGDGSADVEVMRRFPGWTAKYGAEGLLTLRSPDGTGFALKVEDGATRAFRPAVAAFLRPFGVALPDWERVPVRNSRGDGVGEIVARTVGEASLSTAR